MQAVLFTISALSHFPLATEVHGRQMGLSSLGTAFPTGGRQELQAQLESTKLRGRLRLRPALCSMSHSGSVQVPRSVQGPLKVDSSESLEQEGGQTTALESPLMTLTASNAPLSPFSPLLPLPLHFSLLPLVKGLPVPPTV